MNILKCKHEFIFKVFGYTTRFSIMSKDHSQSTAVVPGICKSINQATDMHFQAWSISE